MSDIINNRSIETEGATAKLADLRQEKDDLDMIIKNLETRFLAEFQENYDSTKAQQLQNEINGMKVSLQNINTEIGNLERIGTEYVERTETVDETR